MEFGSDFHLLNYPQGNSFLKYFPKANLYTSGRQSLMALATARCWNRIWIPSYFCEETLNVLKRNGFELRFYHHHPIKSLEESLKNITFKEGDAVLVVNYFGLGLPINYNLSGVDVIEDHTHDLIQGAIRPTSAEWCIASLRKTLPIADGGILWSPKGLSLPSEAIPNLTTERTIERRYDAMKLKTEYLMGGKIEKERYLNEFKSTEEAFDTLPMSMISKQSLDILGKLDIDSWYKRKKDNYEVLKNIISLPNGVRLLKNQIDDRATIFSFCLLFDSNLKRNSVRQSLIENSIYPAILWTIESSDDYEAKNFGDRILSIHCDGRYSTEQIKCLAHKINITLNYD